MARPHILDKPMETRAEVIKIVRFFGSDSRTGAVASAMRRAADRQ